MRKNLSDKSMLAKADEYLWNSKLKQYLKKDENTEAYMDIDYYILNLNEFNKKISLETLLYLYYDDIHWLLWNFLARQNLRLMLFYKRLYSRDLIWGKKLQVLSKICRQLNRTINMTDLIELVKNKISLGVTNRDMAELISEAYKKLGIIISELDIAKQRNIVNSWKAFDVKKYQEYDSEYLKPVVNFQSFVSKYMNHYLVNAFVHGSLSTLDYKKGFSDFDTLLIVKESVVNNIDKLLKLQDLYYYSVGYLFALDPWQHHSHFVICEYDMNFYNQATFPLVLFEYSTGLLNNQNTRLSFALRDDALECRYAFWSRIAELRDTCLNNRHPQTFFEFKRLIAIVLLLPCLCLGLDEEHSYKKYSFRKVRAQLPNQSWEIIDKMTVVRDLCVSARSMPGPFYKSLIKYNPTLIRRIFIKFHNDVPKYLVNILGPNYLNEVFTFVESMVSQTKEKGLL